MGNAAGTGATRRSIAHGESYLNSLSKEIKSTGGEVGALAACSPILCTFLCPRKLLHISSKNSHFPASQYSICTALFSPFLEVTPEEMQESLNTNVVAAFSFSREAIIKFKENTTDAENPNCGTLGVAASACGNTMTSGFAIGKFGARGQSQSLVKYTQNHDRRRPRAQRGSPESPASIAQSYLSLVNQEKSAWTWELDLRPAHEKW
ncbi:hypothetical protein B0H19DRAFT_1210960 [Mycena capillaripes]|nr:hypothetical protein B0H19DRAFT_1210960 [Mycena capillaripes]